MLQHLLGRQIVKSPALQEVDLVAGNIASGRLALLLLARIVYNGKMQSLLIEGRPAEERASTSCTTYVRLNVSPRKADSPA